MRIASVIILSACSIRVATAGRLHSVWTVVHVKKRASGRADPSPTEAPAKTKSVKEQIWDYGRELCKNRPDHPHCAHFKDPEASTTAAATPSTEPNTTSAPPAELEEEKPSLAPTTATTVGTSPPPETTSVTLAAPTSTTLPPLPETTTPAPETASTSMLKSTSVSTSLSSSTRSRVLSSAPISTTAPTAESTTRRGPARLQSQGFEGELVSHEDGQTATADWHNEYKHSSTSALPPAQRAAASGRSAATLLLCVLLPFVPFLLNLP